MKHFFSATSLWALLLLLTVTQAARSQAPAWQTAEAASQARSTQSIVTATASDAAGNVYVTGSFYGTVSFGSIALTSAGSKDVFVAKWNRTNGGFVWAQRAGGTYEDQANAITVSGSNVYVAGSFQSLTIGFGTTTLANAGSFNPDVFVAKLTDAGSFVWAQQAGGTEQDIAYAIGVSGTNVYLAGFFGSFFANATATFGSTTVTTAGGSDVFVAKLTDAGPSAVFRWAQRAGGADFDQANGLAVRGTDVYVTGFFHSATANFGSITLTNGNNNTSPRTNDVFVAKLTDTGGTGGFGWALRAGGAGNDEGNAVAVSGAGIFVVGYFNSASASFGSSILTNASTTGTGDGFVSKLTEVGGTGSFAWAQRAGGTGDDVARGVAIQGTNVYMVGGFEGPTAGFGSTLLTNAGSAFTQDVFVAKLADAAGTGSFSWAQSGGSAGPDFASAVSIAGGNIYVGGNVSPPASFGSLNLLSSSSGPVAFLASLTDPTLTATTAALRSESIGLFPNPAHNHATVQLPTGSGPATLTLLDALGRTIRTQTATNANAELDLTGLAPGLYAVRVAAGGSAATRRLAVE